MTRSLEIHDLPDSGQLQLVLQAEDGPVAAPATPFSNPLASSDRAEISWYFQEYLDSPFGPNVERAGAVENGFRNLGRLLYEMVFPEGESRQLLDTALSEGGENCELRIASSRAEFLSLPWELLNNPESGYLVSGFSSLARQTESSDQTPFDAQLTTEQLNILAAAPYVADQNESYSCSLSRTLLPVLEGLNVEVELDFLRPPTFEALANKLEQNPSRYHVVHLDGIVLDDEGYLLLETQGSSAQAVAAAQLGRVLMDAGVPLVFISAGSRGGRPEPQRQAWERIGLALASAGVPASILIPTQLRGAAATEGFLRRFYQSLVQGQDAGESLAAARGGLMDEPHRPALSGPQVSWDWITPSVYRSRSYSPPAIVAQQANPLAPPAIQQQQEEEPESQFPVAGQYGLIGRDAEMAQLERACWNETAWSCCPEILVSARLSWFLAWPVGFSKRVEGNCLAAYSTRPSRSLTPPAWNG